jgi:hypothetical protein
LVKAPFGSGFGLAETNVNNCFFVCYSEPVPMRLETGFDQVVDVVRDEGNKLLEHIDQAVARLHAMPGGVVSRTWASEQAIEEPISVIDPVGGQITLLEDTAASE